MEIQPLNQRYKVDGNQKTIPPMRLSPANPTPRGIPQTPKPHPTSQTKLEALRTRPLPRPVNPAYNLTSSVQNYGLFSARLPALPSKPAAPRPILAACFPPPAPATRATHQVEAGELLLASPLNHARLSSASMQRTDFSAMHMHLHPQQMRQGGGRPKARLAPKMK